MPTTHELNAIRELIQRSSARLHAHDDDDRVIQENQSQLIILTQLINDFTKEVELNEEECNTFYWTIGRYGVGWMAGTKVRWRHPQVTQNLDIELEGAIVNFGYSIMKFPRYDGQRLVFSRHAHASISLTVADPNYQTAVSELAQRYCTDLRNMRTQP